MKIRKVIQALLLGGMMMIVGCEQSNTTNNERSEIEDKFSRLGEVYPTKDLEELMEKFPNKEIQINHFETKKGKDNKIYTYYIKYKLNKGITAEVSIKDSNVTPEYELEKFNIVYNKETKKFEREDGKELIPEVANVKFLFQMLDIKNNPLKNWQIERATKIRNTDSYTVSYTIRNEELAKYLETTKDMKDIMIDISGSLNDSSEGRLGTLHLSVENEENELLESIITKEY